MTWNYFNDVINEIKKNQIFDQILGIIVEKKSYTKIKQNQILSGPIVK